MHQIPWLAQCQFDPVPEDPCRIADYSIQDFDIHGRNSWLLQGQISSSNGAHNPYGDEIIPFSPISDLVCVLPMWLKEIGEKEENGAVPSSSLVAQVEQSEDFWSEVENLVQENNYVLAMPPFETGEITHQTKARLMRLQVTSVGQFILPGPSRLFIDPGYDVHGRHSCLYSLHSSARTSLFCSSLRAAAALSEVGLGSIEGA